VRQITVVVGPEAYDHRPQHLVRAHELDEKVLVGTRKLAAAAFDAPDEPLMVVARRIDEVSEDLFALPLS
jgi:hypothetical protein